MHNFSQIINQNWISLHKWTLINDFDSICYENYLKYSTDIIDISDLTSDLTNVQSAIYNSMKKGNWLVFNFNYLPVWFDEIFQNNIIPREILDPKIVFNLTEGYNIFIKENIVVSTTFRLIALSKSTEYDSNIMGKFKLISIDKKKFKIEQEEELIMKRSGK